MSENNPWFEPGQPARPTDIKADKADLDMRLERKALAEGWDRTADKLDAAQSELAALREELARKDVVIEDMLESNSDMTTCLAAAERRTGDLELSLMWVRSQLTDAVIIRFIDIALKPTESGASE